MEAAAGGVFHFWLWLRLDVLSAALHPSKAEETRGLSNGAHLAEACSFVLFYSAYY